jgi:hypothetical protein
MANEPGTYIGEDAGWPRDKLAAHGFQAVRRVTVPWLERYDWAELFLFDADYQLYPYMVAAGINVKSCVVSVGIEPAASQLTHGSNATSEAVYELAYLTIAYQACGFNFNRDVLIEEIRPILKEEEDGPVGLYWDTKAADPLVDPVRRVVGGFNFDVVYPRMSDCPNAAFTLCGTCNKEVFVPRMFPNISFAPGQLIYPTPDVIATLTFGGSPKYRVAYHLLAHPYDVNLELNPKTGQRQKIYLSDGTQYNRYPPAIYAGII